MPYCMVTRKLTYLGAASAQIDIRKEGNYHAGCQHTAWGKSQKPRLAVTTTAGNTITVWHTGHDFRNSPSKRTTVRKKEAGFTNKPPFSTCPTVDSDTPQRLRNKRQNGVLHLGDEHRSDGVHPARMGGSHLLHSSSERGGSKGAKGAIKSMERRGAAAKPVDRCV